jgi:hypothetical protein
MLNKYINPFETFSDQFDFHNFSLQIRNEVPESYSLFDIEQSILAFTNQKSIQIFFSTTVDITENQLVSILQLILGHISSCKSQHDCQFLIFCLNSFLLLPKSTNFDFFAPYVSQIVSSIKDASIYSFLLSLSKKSKLAHLEILKNIGVEILLQNIINSSELIIRTNSLGLISLMESSMLNEHVQKIFKVIQMILQQKEEIPLMIASLYLIIKYSKIYMAWDFFFMRFGILQNVIDLFDIKNSTLRSAILNVFECCFMNQFDVKLFPINKIILQMNSQIRIIKNSAIKTISALFFRNPEYIFQYFQSGILEASLRILFSFDPIISSNLVRLLNLIVQSLLAEQLISFQWDLFIPPLIDSTLFFDSKHIQYTVDFFLRLLNLSSIMNSQDQLKDVFVSNEIFYVLDQVYSVASQRCQISIELLLSKLS